MILALTITMPKKFQSTPSRGGRHDFGIDYHYAKKISIHALTRRATRPDKNLDGQAKNFNPRPHEEGDTIEFSTSIEARNFNPRPHEEGDRKQPC